MRATSTSHRSDGDMRLTGTALAALVTLAAPLAAQDFSWSGRVAAGKELEIKGVNGWVRAEAATGDEIVVTANKRAKDDDPADVKIEVVEHAGGVTICAVYPTPERSRHENECAPGSGGHMNTEDNDVKVDFTVKVPAGVRFTGHTVNGDVEAEGLGGDVDVATVNGDVSVTTRGRAEASTVNGGITVRMGRADWTGDLSFSTVNGGIETEFPLTVSGRFGMRRIRGTVGQGGRTLELETVNGSIRLRKQGST